ncbi:hypothetical protein KQX54_012102 [Cotesia glomerata]|uniref:F-box domain-containing protein n=1 Tax=Cotesia glomerata TaxID=32391 RepID=A0AAV7ILI1_COTGL|nr:hypothetical protein KQX54_012102 [Cotesia glomerata]
MSAIIIPEHVLFRIFKHMDPITLLKHRYVHKYMKDLIEQDFGIWRRLILKTSEITPWKEQLINLRYPYIKRENYNRLTSEEYRELFFEFIKLSRAKNIFCVNKLSVTHPPIQNDHDIHFDTCGNYFGCFSRGSNYLALFRLDTGEMLIDPVNIFEYANASIENPHRRLRVQQFMMWCPDENRLFCIFVHEREGLVIIDVKQRLRIRTPTLISEMPIMRRDGNYTSFKLVNNSSGDDIYAQMHIQDSFHIVRLRWATESQNLVAEHVFLIEPPFLYLGITPIINVNNSTITLIYIFSNKKVLFQAKVPETIISPVQISENSRIDIFVMNKDSTDFYINVHNSQIFTVVDRPSIVKVYRLKNPLHLLHLTFVDPPNLKLTLKTDINFAYFRHIKIKLKNDKLCLVCYGSHEEICILPFQ